MSCLKWLGGVVFIGARNAWNYFWAMQAVALLPVSDDSNTDRKKQQTLGLTLLDMVGPSTQTWRKFSIFTEFDLFIQMLFARLYPQHFVNVNMSEEDIDPVKNITPTIFNMQ